MAPIKKPETVSAPTETTVVTKSQVEIENEFLKTQLEEMKKMIESLKVATTTSETVNSQNGSLFIDESQIAIPSNKLIPVMSMVSGSLNLDANGKRILFRDFGTTQQISFEDLRAVYNTHPVIIEDGWLLIQNIDVVKALYLENKYENFVSKKFIEDIITLPADEIIKTLSNLTQSLRTTAIDIIIKGISERNNKFSDLNKIQVISDYIGQDINELAKNR
ncbi:hypothetical protein BC351_00325 [Paenibacillus ferrarius]|uniref:Uncharacterized protein n=1 Tax=Paenibacillus ferrarius TaxID=1469647 RepID=A0A1V4HSC2_9BACL|nr:hypothetical protein [Paenibacillus ferrarius]OPH61722.1 hypothetical protein BC351_00325 [Paenibacillus ferrarius]